MDLLANYLYDLFPVFFRALGLVIFLPIGTAGTNALTKFLLAIVIGLFCAGHVPYAPHLSAVGIFGEILIGIMIGLPTALLVNCAAMVGELIDTTRGQNIGQQYDPFLETSGSQLSLMLQSYMWAYLLLLGAFDGIMSGFVNSFSQISAGGFGLSSVSHHGYLLLQFIVPALDGMMSVFLPFALVCVGINFMGGYLGKLLPQISLSGELFQVKTVIAFVTLSAVCENDLATVLKRLALPQLGLLGP